MINLLPPEIKEERKFGRLNKLLTKQLVGMVVIGVLAVGFMLFGVALVDSDERLIQEMIEQRTQEYARLRVYEEQAQSLNADVQTIGQLFDRELRFSSLLVNIASSIPEDARLTSLSLQGGVEQPLTITAVVSSQEAAGVLRKSLVDSENFTNADILNITNGGQDESGNTVEFNVTINATLSESAKLPLDQGATESVAEVEPAPSDVPEETEAPVDEEQTSDTEAEPEVDETEEQT